METMTKEKKVKANGTTEKVVIELSRLEVKRATFKIKGSTPLIVNRFPEKAQKQIEDKVTGKNPKGKTPRKPKEEYLASLYKFSDGKKTGFPAVGVKASMVRAGKQLGLTMTDLRGKFHVLADDGDLIEIKGKHAMRTDMVRLVNGSADVRYRAEYKDWGAEITIVYNINAISEEQLAGLLQQAGFSCGLGEWRCEKSNSGSYGLFELA